MRVILDCSVQHFKCTGHTLFVAIILFRYHNEVVLSGWTNTTFPPTGICSPSSQSDDSQQHSGCL